ncbi:cryptochrome/photolyase family protein [Jatrophihabitans sp.]|uniref:cryptochrome/photolyase family protein n=1 Tax=Jatrophihabitans sp. TaxID=1932789 RepID=UPI002F0A6AFA
MPAVMWFRRDLRLLDNPALVAATEAGDGSVLGVFVLDPALLRPSGAPRLAVLYRTLRVLDSQLGGNLVVRHGSPGDVLSRLCQEVATDSVHCAADFGPYGAARDEAVAQALPVPLVRTGSAYAVAPGRVVNSSGESFKVYSAFYRGWRRHGWPQPARTVRPRWISARSDGLPADPELPDGLRLPDVGEAAAGQAWRSFVTDRIEDYADQRDRPDLDRTSHMSVHLKWGTIHPRTLLADLAPGHEVYRKELAWREFYADVLYHRPDSARQYYHGQLQGLPFATGSLAEQRLAAWAAGRTGYPIVDAGMRQILAEGWMHNRVRMIVASFLVKDLHVEWTDGARYFMRHLVDGDLASNAHGWQWVAGTGTDPAPYYRIFNPVLQGKKFDPAGDYVRRYVPELAELPAKYIHEPWRDPAGLPAGYPERIVDHATERSASLADYNQLREAHR